MARVLLVCNTAWSVYNFRLALLRQLQLAGHDVWAVSPPDDFVAPMRRYGISHIPVRMNRKGTNPAEDMLLTYRLFRIFRRYRPQLILTYRAKPNIYGSIAARCLGIPVINTVTGLGTAFGDKSALVHVAELLYRLAFRGSARVIFQNEDDLQRFVRRKLVRSDIVERISGSGVDTDRFAPTAPRVRPDPFVFLFVARLLREKGIAEYAAASKRLRERGIRVECRVLGYLDPGNPSAIPRDQLEAWIAQGDLSYVGASTHVERVMQEADCVVLPSYYREGLPRVLLEAAAMGKPLITTDAPGCRDVVKDGENGFLCRPRDAADLAEKMAAMAMLSEDVRGDMGRRNREKACREYDQRIVVDRYLQLVDQITLGPTVPISGAAGAVAAASPARFH